MTVENFNTIKQNVITLGGFTDSQLLTLQIKMLIDEILAYCYRKDVPTCMELPISDVIVGEIKRRSMISGIEGDITSYREGDMSVNFGSQTSTTTGAKYNGRLEGFKKIIGVVECSETTNAQ